jgi:hypothetical protein
MEAKMDVHTALKRIECGMGDEKEANMLRALLGELDVLTRGAICALDARDILHALQWVERMQRVLDKAHIREDAR